MTRPPGPALFTPADRSRVLDQLLAFAGTTPAILGALVVGSGAAGFRDEYSDLDVVFVGEPARFAAVVDATRRFVDDRLRPVFSTAYQHRDDVLVLCLLLENYLEVDLGFWSSAALFASSPNWTLVQARDPQAAETIVAAMADRPRLERPYPPIVTGDDPTWQPVYAAFIAARRAAAARCGRTFADADLPASAAIDPGDLTAHQTTDYTAKQRRFLAALIDASSP